MRTYGEDGIASNVEMGIVRKSVLLGSIYTYYYNNKYYV